LLLQIAVVPLCLALVWPVFTDWLTRDGKPFIFTEGISLWPTELIRLFALLLGGYLLITSWRSLAVNQDSITQQFSLEENRSEIGRSQERAEAGLGCLTRMANMFRLGDVAPHMLLAFRSCELPFEVAKIWQRHIVQSRLSARIVRASTCVLLTLFLSLVIGMTFGEARFVPQRGTISVAVHETLHALVFLMLYMLVFFAADAAFLCVSFIRLLRERRSVWPAKTFRHFEKMLGFAHDGLIDHWADLELLAQRTQAINHLIYYPFILLSLVLLSRSSAFDDWAMPLSGKVLTVLGALIALCGPVALRTAAERSREAALKDLDVALMQASGKAAGGVRQRQHQLGPPTVRQLELLRERIARLSRGAFAPYSQQPLLKALVLPFVTVGGTSLLELLRMANL
jgi:hypothetical protein